MAGCGINAMNEFYLQHEPTYNKYYIRRLQTTHCIGEYYIKTDDIVFWRGIGETLCYTIKQLTEILMHINNEKARLNDI